MLLQMLKSATISITTMSTNANAQARNYIEMET